MLHQLFDIASAISAAASLSGAGAIEPMQIRGPAAPPAGYTDFCVREPEACGGGAHEALQAMGSTVRDAGHAPAATAPGGRWLLKALSAIRSDSSATEKARPMTPGRWRQMVEINTRVNEAIAPQSDAQTWGVADYWAMSVSAGDCEDYALAKRQALLSAGFPAESLNLAVVATPTGEIHAVLLVALREGEFVLDNLSPWVRPWNVTGYAWRVRQVNGEAFRWAEVG